MNNIISDNGHGSVPEGSMVRVAVDTRADTTSVGPAASLTHSGSGEAAMEHVNLAGLLKQATPYESWRAPIHPRLRLAAIASGPAVVICLPAILAVLALAAVALAESLLISDPGAWLLGALCTLLTFLVLLDLASLAVYAAMLVFTKGLREARPHWHWVAVGEAVVGAIHGIIVAVGLAIVLVASVIGVVLLCLFVVAAIVALLGAVAGSSS